MHFIDPQIGQELSSSIISHKCLPKWPTGKSFYLILVVFGSLTHFNQPLGPKKGQLQPKFLNWIFASIVKIKKKSIFDLDQNRIQSQAIQFRFAV